MHLHWRQPFYLEQRGQMKVLASLVENNKVPCFLTGNFI